MKPRRAKKESKEEAHSCLQVQKGTVLLAFQLP